VLLCFEGVTDFVLWRHIFEKGERTLKILKDKERKEQ